MSDKHAQLNRCTSTFVKLIFPLWCAYRTSIEQDDGYTAALLSVILCTARLFLYADPIAAALDDDIKLLYLVQ